MSSVKSSSVPGIRRVRSLAKRSRFGISSRMPGARRLRSSAKVARHVIITKERFEELLGYHASWPLKPEVIREVSGHLFASAPDGLAFPFSFQNTMCDVLRKELNEWEAYFVYDSVYRMIHEMELGTVLRKNEATCFEDTEPIPRKFYKRPAGYYD